jgi:LmbE family N-acetylglucosaminyl deacetylase
MADNKQRKLLCIFAHPDDEVFCTGGTIAQAVADGVEVMVVSATDGGAGQINDATVATRRTLGKRRAQELHDSCRELGAQHVECLDYGDGTLKDLDLTVLVEHVTRILRDFKPNVVITFGPDGGYGHPDHVTISLATTLACTLSGSADQFPDQGLTPHAVDALYHAYFPPKPILMLDRLSEWLEAAGGGRAGVGDQVKDVTEFVRALLVFAEETTLLQYSQDRMDIKWFPKGFYIIEQGEAARDLYLIMTGSAEAVHEEEDGELKVLGKLGPGHFFGEMGIARRATRSNHVVARENVTCLVRGSQAAITGGEDRLAQIMANNPAEHPPYTAAIDVSAFIQQKVAAMAAHRTQYPIMPNLIPASILIDLMGHEYFTQVIPAPKITTDLFEGR